jgi:hypothetical protein
MPDTRLDSRLLLQKLASIALMCIAGLLWAVFLYGMTSGRLGAIGGGVTALIGTLAARRGVRLFNRDRQIETATTDNKCEANDNRPPVLYLRSFKDDAITAAAVSSGAAWGGLAVKTEEEQLAKVLTAIGPVVAIGKPGEELPELGARRIYLRSEEWKERVSELMRKAALVVLRPGETPSVWWEISEVMKQVRPERRLLVLSFDSAQYADFQQEFQKMCGFMLPTYRVNKPLKLGSIHAFVYFNTDGLPKFVGINTNLVPFLRRAVRERLVPYFSVALRPLLVRIGVIWHQPPVSMFIVLFLSLFALFFLAFFASLLGCG